MYKVHYLEKYVMTESPSETHVQWLYKNEFYI